MAIATVVSPLKGNTSREHLEHGDAQGSKYRSFHRNTASCLFRGGIMYDPITLDNVLLWRLGNPKSVTFTLPSLEINDILRFNILWIIDIVGRP